MAKTTKPEPEQPQESTEVNPGVAEQLQEPIPTQAPAAVDDQDPNEWVDARRKGVIGRARVPRRALKFMPGWEEVTSAAPATNQDA